MSNAITYRGPSLDELHEEYAKRGCTDAKAAIHARREITLTAPADRIWKILTDVPAWASTLEPGVHDIELESGVVVDGVFRRTNRGMRMTARFAVVRPGREIAWTGYAFGAKAVHRFELHPLSADNTRVVVEESMSGPLLGLFISSRKLTALLDGSLAALKSAAETALHPSAVGR